MTVKTLSNKANSAHYPWQKHGFRVMVRHGNRRYTTDFFTMGESPKPSDVLDCLEADIRLSQHSFPEWCRILQLPVSEEWKPAYEMCLANGAGMRRVLGL